MQQQLVFLVVLTISTLIIIQSSLPPIICARLQSALSNNNNNNINDDQSNGRSRIHQQLMSSADENEHLKIAQSDEFKFVPLLFTSNNGQQQQQQHSRQQRRQLQLHRQQPEDDQYKSVGMSLNSIDDDHQAIDLNKLNELRYDFITANEQPTRFKSKPTIATSQQQQQQQFSQNNHHINNKKKQQFDEKDVREIIERLLTTTTNNEGGIRDEKRIGKLGTSAATNNQRLVVNSFVLPKQRATPSVNADRSQAESLLYADSEDYTAGDLRDRAVSNADEAFSPLPKRHNSLKCRGGLGHDCDVNEFLTAVSDRRHWDSPISPGR